MSPRCPCCYGKVKIAYCPECGGPYDRSGMEMVLKARNHRDTRTLTLLEELAHALGVQVSWRPREALKNQYGEGRPRPTEFQD